MVAKPHLVVVSVAEAAERLRPKLIRFEITSAVHRADKAEAQMSRRSKSLLYDEYFQSCVPYLRIQYPY